MKTKTSANDLDLRRLWRAMRRNWWLYALTFVVFMGAATIYSLFRMPLYDSHSTMLIETSGSESSLMAAAGASGKSSAAMRMLNLGSATTANEMVLLTSVDVMSKVIRDAGLNVRYIGHSGLKKTALYPSSPIVAQIPQQVLDTLQKGALIKAHLHDGKVDLKVVKGPKGIITVKTVENVKLPYDLKTPGLTVRLAATGDYRPDADENIDIVVMGTNDALKLLNENLTIEQADKKSDAIAMQMRGSSKLLDETVLNLLMDTYNKKRLDRRRETAALEVEYCNDRLEKLMSQLAESEHKVEDFKRRNNTMVMKLDSTGWISKSIGSRVETAKAQNQLTYYDQVIFALERDKENNTFVPASFDGQERNPLAEQYNELVAKKHDLERSATSDNPALRNINMQLAEMRTTLLDNFRNNVQMARSNLSSLYSLREEAQSEMQEVPALERELFDLMRDKTIKNEIYLYLLQRREAADLRLHATDTYGFVVDRAWTEVKPLQARSYTAFAAAFVLSLLLPTLLLWFLMRRRDALRQPMDTAFIGIEENTVDGTDGGIDALRAKIMSTPGLKTIYVADVQHGGESETVNALADSLRALGAEVATVTPDDIRPGADTADVYLTRAAADHLQALADKSDYVLAICPDAKRLSTITSAVDADGARLLLIATAGRTRRATLRHLLRSQMAEHVILYIRPK